VRQRQIRLLHDLDSAPQYLTRVKVKASDRILFLKVEQIDWIEAADNYVVLHSGKQTHMLREKLSALENALDPERFFRISRSTLVNVHRISELRSMFKGEHMVILADGSRLPMTRGISELEELVAFS
jgi:two-component system LytT family response regulator